MTARSAPVLIRFPDLRRDRKAAVMLGQHVIPGDSVTVTNQATTERTAKPRPFVATLGRHRPPPAPLPHLRRPLLHERALRRRLEVVPLINGALHGT